MKALYATQTVVPEEKSRADIEKMLREDFGAIACASGYAPNGTREIAFVTFRMYDRSVRIAIKMPTLADVSGTMKGRTRSKAMALKSLAQARRQRWRSLWLAIRAKMDRVAGELTDEEQAEMFRREFLADTVVGRNQTVFEVMDERISEAYLSGGLPSLALPGAGETH